MLGKQRSGILGTLFKDERCKRLEEFSILEKMFLDRIIRANDIARLDAMLAPHHKTITVDGKLLAMAFYNCTINNILNIIGLTLLDQAMVQHNILAASKVYRNIQIVNLGDLLGIEPSKAEKITRQMMAEGHLEGSIDQIAGYVHFRCKLHIFIIVF